MVRVSDKYSEGLGFESQLDPGFFFRRFISHSDSQPINMIHERLLSPTVKSIQPLMGKMYMSLLSLIC